MGRGPLGSGTFNIVGMGDVVLRVMQDGYLGRKGGKFGSFPVRLADGDYGDVVVSNDGTSMTLDVDAIPARAVTAVFDGGGVDVAAGAECWVQVPYAGTITRWTLLGDAVGSIVIDVWKDTFANFPPTVGDTIAGTEKPTLTAAQSAQDTALTTWSDVTVDAGDVLLFHVDSCSGITRATLILWVTV